MAQYLQVLQLQAQASNCYKIAFFFQISLAIHELTFFVLMICIHDNPHG